MIWRHPIRFLAPAAAIALAAPAAVTAQAPVTLATVQQHLAQANSMTADFSQTDRTGKVLTGKLTLKKPGKIRFQYEKGVPILVVSDGKSLYFLDYQVGQKQRWPIGNSPLGILLDPSRDASRYARVLPDSDSRVVSVEAYDPKHPEYGRITLIFARNASAPAGLMLQGWVTLDAQNNRTTIRLSNQRFNVPVADSAFRFNEPRRTQNRR
ncbi:outer membrane lipoprotein carrier protein LolA [Sphingomonas sp. PL-96]|uniref:LolA family protein n=1 Tax=Sphingomonas sp. PL-96 TaxID=2887201 RepID=UPI001E4E6620|nr:outer membrane lipoprotein carrier protein LolA [Sphingomonas sp. PL-96]MCC2977682.1 outer membrane lipoprotein carrier protein LolA [Sphingomonas sp. PL-96]